jgi:exodeoxyribonuclease VII large subunit
MTFSDSLELPLQPQRQILTVSALNRDARLALEHEFGTVWVEGEMSNFSRPASGHWYFSLKDAQAQIRCAMFRGQNRHAAVQPADGRQILVRARVTLYEARGDFQLVVDYMEEAGEGLLRRKFEELKRRLSAEGLFDTARKQSLPRLPSRIGVVTSATGAALRDVLTALRRRCPSVAVLIYPTAVQGDSAAADIVRTLALAERRGDCDLLILTRGGGSLEDLAAFNDEQLARQIASLTTPIIVGVGHETDVTIADFVADLRAPTPSQAAELAVPDQREWRTKLARDALALRRSFDRILAAPRSVLAHLGHRLLRAHPGMALRQREQRADELESRLVRAMERRLAATTLSLQQLAAAVSAADPRLRLMALAERCSAARQRLRQAALSSLEARRNRLRLAARALATLSPLATLERGYAIVSTGHGSVIRDSDSAPAGTDLEVRLARGQLKVTVRSTQKAGT